MKTYDIVFIAIICFIVVLSIVINCNCICQEKKNGTITTGSGNDVERNRDGGFVIIPVAAAVSSGDHCGGRGGHGGGCGGGCGGL